MTNEDLVGVAQVAKGVGSKVAAVEDVVPRDKWAVSFMW